MTATFARNCCVDCCSTSCAGWWSNRGRSRQKANAVSVVTKNCRSGLYASKQYIRKRSVGDTNSSRTLSNPASWPSECHLEIVSGKSAAWT
jgi:hypothetical protein